MVSPGHIATRCWKSQKANVASAMLQPSRKLAEKQTGSLSNDRKRTLVYETCLPTMTGGDCWKVALVSTVHCPVRQSRCPKTGRLNLTDSLPTPTSLSSCYEDDIIPSSAYRTVTSLPNSQVASFGMGSVQSRRRRRLPCAARFKAWITFSRKTTRSGRSSRVLIRRDRLHRGDVGLWRHRRVLHPDRAPTNKRIRLYAGAAAHTEARKRKQQPARNSDGNSNNVKTWTRLLKRQILSCANDFTTWTSVRRLSSHPAATAITTTAVGLRAPVPTRTAAGSLRSVVRCRRNRSWMLPCLRTVCRLVRRWTTASRAVFLETPGKE